MEIHTDDASEVMVEGRGGLMSLISLPNDGTLSCFDAENVPKKKDLVETSLMEMIEVLYTYIHIQYIYIYIYIYTRL